MSNMGYQSGSAKGLSQQHFPHVAAVAAVTCSHRPSYVMIANQGSAGNLYFNFTTTGSIGAPVHRGHGAATTHDSGATPGDGDWIDFTYATSSVNNSGRIDISPTAWSSSNGISTGPVLFVYNDGKP